MRVNRELDREVQAALPPLPPDGCADYLRSSWELRRAPSETFPWAKSIIIHAIAFSELPPADLPRADDPEFAGLIAGYASRLDYHRVTLPLPPGRSELAIDTKPLAEKTLAAIAGIGSIGKNRCLLLPGADSGVFIASIISDQELPEERFPEQANCLDCGSCGEVQPPSNCISFLTMEKRGELPVEERAGLGDRIFGCSDCTAVCPGTRLPDDFPLDLEWLLFSSGNEVARVIRETPLNYAGATLLRRNALYVLANRKTKRCRDLISEFSRKTGSDFLRNISHGLL